MDVGGGALRTAPSARSLGARMDSGVGFGINEPGPIQEHLELLGEQLAVGGSLCPVSRVALFFPPLPVVPAPLLHASTLHTYSVGVGGGTT